VTVGDGIGIQLVAQVIEEHPREHELHGEDRRQIDATSAWRASLVDRTHRERSTIVVTRVVEYRRRARVLGPMGLWLDAVTVSLGAFLLFQVQPIIAADILPWFGGTAAVWTVCMLFFQTALLLGYAYGHLLARGRRTRVLAGVHASLLIASLALLPIVPDAAWKPAGDEDPTVRILCLLSATIGLPYLLLSTTGPLVQLWLSRREPAAQPYRLFALGNLAALVALVGYPFLVQPALGVSRQLRWWSWGYASYVAVCLIVTIRSARVTAAAARDPDVPDGASRIDAGTAMLWIALSSCPSMLFLAVTNHLTRDVAPVPLLWILPLSIYLFTLVLCFDHPRWYRPVPYRVLLFAAFVAIAFGLSPTAHVLGVRGNTVLFASALFVACMTCHGELARLKPPPRHLTAFYMMVACGGALGGLFVGLVAPRIFVTHFELPLAVAGSVALVLAVLYRETPPDRRRAGRRAVFAGALALGCFLWAEGGRRAPGERVRLRNFFGTLATGDVDDAPGRRRLLSHGVVVHGLQFLDETRRREPTAYFGHRSGAGRALDRLGNAGALRVGVVGLGAGVLAAYARPGDYYRFYEINPLMVRVASSEFTFIADAPSTTDVVVGDGRLALEREPSQRFDLLLLDAFSGDSVPVHLLTSEAFTIYFRHLRPGGVLAVNVTNTFLDLKPIVAAVAQSVGKSGFFLEDRGDPALGTALSEWMLVVDGSDVPRDVGATPILPGSVAPWTDDYASLRAALR
jgi:hypothetical protein